MLTLADRAAAQAPEIEIWHGDRQRVGHLGEAQDDFNVLGHVGRWRDLDTLSWSIRRRGAMPVSFRAFRRLAEDGDFNIDVPIAWLFPGENTINLKARFRDGTEATRPVVVLKETGEVSLPMRIDWQRLSDPQEAGQYVDGHWTLTPGGLRTVKTGYDRIFLIGSRTWRDYEVRAALTVNSVAPTTRPGVGFILRFTGHLVGGPGHYPSGQPKWGYEPLGGTGWLRWIDGADRPPHFRFIPGFSGEAKDPVDFGEIAFALHKTYALRFRCVTLKDTPVGEGVTRYEFKIWRAGEPEPPAWTGRHVQTSREALRNGGLGLLAHHVDATFGDIEIAPISPDSP